MYLLRGLSRSLWGLPRVFNPLDVCIFTQEIAPNWAFGALPPAGAAPTRGGGGQLRKATDSMPPLLLAGRVGGACDPSPRAVVTQPGGTQAAVVGTSTGRRATAGAASPSAGASPGPPPPHYHGRVHRRLPPPISQPDFGGQPHLLQPTVPRVAPGD